MAVSNACYPNGLQQLRCCTLIGVISSWLPERWSSGGGLGFKALLRLTFLETETSDDPRHETQLRNKRYLFNIWRVVRFCSKRLCYLVTKLFCTQWHCVACFQHMVLLVRLLQREPYIFYSYVGHVFVCCGIVFLTAMVTGCPTNWCTSCQKYSCNTRMQACRIFVNRRHEQKGRQDTWYNPAPHHSIQFNTMLCIKYEPWR